MPLSLRSLSSLLLLSLVAAAEARGQEVARPALEPQLLADAADGVLDQFDLPSACLIAAGVSDERELGDLQLRLVAGLRWIDQSATNDAPASERAKVIQQQLHEQVLTGKYDEQATDLRRTLASGDYNCLSALVLYVELCRRADVPLVIRSQPGHVYCALPHRSPHAPREENVTRSVTPTMDLRIEPASRMCLDSQKFAAPTAPSRSITPIQLVGKVYYNRGIAQLERREFAAGIESLRRACQLDPLDADARTNLLAGLNNWALALLEQGDASAASALIARGLAIDPHFAPLVANQRYLRARIAAP